MLAPHRPSENHLLGALPEEVLERLAPHLERVPMPLGRVLYESGAPVHEAYFPTSSIVSMHRLMENGSTAEVALVGPEGMLGLSLFLGAERPNTEVSVQSPGHAFRMRAQNLKEEFGRGGALMQVLLRYTQTFIAQMAQTAACNRHGTLEQRLCRWLLLNLDRMPSGELEMTHELIANALGVRREGVSEAAGRLQRLGAIHYHRGHLNVLDRPALESRACECYRMDQRSAARPQILPH
ncbi:MAG: Crp/Fnr family transcriptional regulator [Caldimonas sp.]